MIFLKRRLFFWLLKAYIKKWGRSFFIFFVLGCILFVLLLRFASGIVVRIPSASHTSIGMAGDYKVDGLPRLVLQDISMGLTRVDEDGRIKPGLAQSWKITQGGKKYEFLLKENQRFADGSMVDSKRIIYSFSDAVVERPSKQKIIFTLKDVYSPFLVSVSRPIFNEKFVGVGDYKIKKIDINGGFVRNIVLANSQNSFVTKSYQFYPSQNALKLAFLLGEIDQASGIMDTEYKNFDLSTFPNTSKHNITNFNRLVTLFYNTKDSVLSDEKIRSALSYALPNTFTRGLRNSTPFSPKSWVYDNGMLPQKNQDIQKATDLLKSSSASSSAGLTITLKAFPKYRHTAEEIIAAWKKIKVGVKVEYVDSVPSDFQIFLGDFQLSKDPDQYSLWHSSQSQNISNYQNLRIDKLLEDGRKTTDIEKRRKIYEDFQKYLLADSPASFLFFPYEYDLIRK